MSEYEAVCEALYKIRMRRGRTLERVAKDLYVSTKWMWNRENNVTCIKVTDLLDLLKYYNVTIDEFITLVRKEMEHDT